MEIDTDEVFGYWEPLHYLQFNKGMQTWEYSPLYAIRSYTFLSPLARIGDVINSMTNTVKPSNIFYFYRFIIGGFSFYCQSVFCNTIYWKVDSNIGIILYWLMFTTAGILFYSTSLLPSAISCNLLMLSISNFIRKSDLLAIGWGCVAVCSTG